MRTTLAAACLIIATAAPGAAAQDRATCPHGQVGDWSWRADSMRFVIENPTLKLDWETIGQPVSTAGLEIDVSMLNGPDTPSAAYVRTAPPTFTHKPENAKPEEKPRVFFGPRQRLQEGVEPEAYHVKHDYALLVAEAVEGEEKLLFAGRFEQWDPGDRRIVAGWLGQGQQSVGWRIVDVEKLRIVAATRFYKGQAGGHDNVARTQLIELGEMDPVWAAARAGHASERARAKATNKTCDWAK